MTIHPTRDSADENDGKYNTDEEMTFEGLLKSSLRERAEQQETLDKLAQKNREQTPPERHEEKRRKQCQKATEQQREETARQEREALATAIGEAHVSEHPSYRFATGETTRIGLETIYEFARTTINDQTYYYVVQTTDESYERHKATLAVKDFGSTWSYNVPAIHTTALQNAIARQRQMDLRKNRDPIDWLSEPQYDAIETWYEARVESALLALEERRRRETCTLHVLDQYLVIDIDPETLLIGRDLRNLTERQIDLVTTHLLELVEANTDMPAVLYDEFRESMDYPFLARLEFDSC